MGFWSGLGKVLKTAAPIAASFIPGVGPIAGTLLGAGVGAGTGALGGGGKKGALIGGLLGAAGGGAKAGLGALGGAGGGSGFVRDAVNGVAASGGGGMPRVGGSFLSKLLDPNVLATAGRGIGSITQSQASNRGTELDAMMEGDRMRMAADRERQASESDLWSKLQATDYMASGGRQPSGPTMSSSGKPFTSFDFGPAPISAGNQEMARTLQPQLMSRLANPPQLSDYASKMKPGMSEKLLNWLGPALSVGGAVRGAGKPDSSNSIIMDWLRSQGQQNG